MQNPLKIAIVGSGLVGSLLAIYLRKSGHNVHIYDRSPDIRTINFSGRSINLAMSNRGWKALDDAGVGEKVRNIAIPMDKRAIHLVNELVEQQYGNNGENIYSISRHKTLRTFLRRAPEKLSILLDRPRTGCLRTDNPFRSLSPRAGSVRPTS